MRNLKRWTQILMMMSLDLQPLWAIEGPLPDWMQRFHIGGNAAVRAMIGQPRAQLERNGGWMVYQAGLTFDIDIIDDLSLW